MIKFRDCYRKGGGGKFAQYERKADPSNQHLCVGGAILSLDLKQAFDRVDRRALALSLKRLGADGGMTAAIISLLDTSRYHIQNDQDRVVCTNRGIRQGCKIAPMLWVAISTLLLSNLGDALSRPYRQDTTFADDTLARWLIESADDVELLSKFLNKLLRVMHDLSLVVNLTKTVLLIKVSGKALRPHSPHILHKEGEVVAGH